MRLHEKQICSPFDRSCGCILIQHWCFRDAPYAFGLCVCYDHRSISYGLRLYQVLERLTYVKGVLAIGVLLVLAVIGLQYFGGSINAEAPTKKPPLPTPPGANEAADQATEGAHGAIDWLQTLSPNTWRIITIMIVAGVVVVLWGRNPKFRWALIGIGIAAVGALLLFS